MAPETALSPSATRELEIKMKMKEKSVTKM
jgi:hypothetical protein